MITPLGKTVQLYNCEKVIRFRPSGLNNSPQVPHMPQQAPLTCVKTEPISEQAPGVDANDNKLRQPLPQKPRKKSDKIRYK